MEEVERILPVKLGRAVKKRCQNPGSIRLSLRNINGRGCCGFVHDTDTGVTVYVDTDASHVAIGHVVRYARDEKDFTGCYNRTRFCTLTEVVSEIVKMISDKDMWLKECASFKKAPVIN